MNKNNRFDELLTALGRVYVGDDITPHSARYAIEKRGFDTEKGENYILLRFAWRRDVDVSHQKLSRKAEPSKKQQTPRAKQPQQVNLKQQNLALVKQINALAKSRGAKIPLAS